MKKSFTLKLFFFACLVLNTCISYGQVDLMQMAKGAYEADDYEQAASYLDQEIKNNPSSPEPYLLYDKIWNAVGNYSAAAQYCSWGLQHMTDKDSREKLTVARASDLFELEIFPATIEQCLKVIADNPKCAEAHNLLALSYLSQNDTTSALSSLRTAQKLCKDDLRIQSLLTEVLSFFGNKSEITKELKRVKSLLAKIEAKENTKISPNLNQNGILDAYHALIICGISLKNYDEAAGYIVDCYTKFNTSIKNNKTLADRYIIEAVSRNVESRKNVILNQPNGDFTYSDLNRYIAELYDNISDNAMTIKYLLQAQHEDVDFNYRFIGLSKLLIYAHHMDKVQELIKIEEDRINAIPDMSSRLNAQRMMKGTCSALLALNEDYEAAADAANEAGDKVADTNTSLIFYGLGKYEKALEFVESALAEEINTVSLMDKAGLLLSLGRDEEAYEAFETIVTLSDENDREQYVGYAGLGLVEKSREAIKSYIEKHKEYSMSYRAAAIAEILNKDYAKAADYLKESLKIDYYSTFEVVNYNFLISQAFKESKEYKEVADMIAKNRDLLNEQLKDILQ